MTVFLSTINQMAFLMLLIAIGYLLVKVKAIPGEGAGILSKLENNVLVPALVMGTFVERFTVDSLQLSGTYFLCGSVVVLVSVPVAVGLARLCHRDSFVRKLYTYGLAFSNFGFMGNAVVSALFPEVFMEYLVFCLPFWIVIYVWGVPSLLMPAEAGKNSFVSRLKTLLNPMFLALIAGMVIGITNLQLPSFLSQAVSTLGSCMSPVAMLLTGMTIARIDLGAALKNVSVYVVSLLRLVILPLAAIGVLRLVPLDYGLALCTVCSLAMPLGLSTIVVPNAYGKDPTVAAGMALVSHLVSVVTIPAVFMLFAVCFG